MPNLEVIFVDYVCQSIDDCRGLHFSVMIAIFKKSNGYIPQTMMCVAVILGWALFHTS